MLDVVLSGVVVLIARAVAKNVVTLHMGCVFYRIAEDICLAKFADSFVGFVMFVLFQGEESVIPSRSLANRIAAKVVVLSPVVDVSFGLVWEDQFASVADVSKHVDQRTLPAFNDANLGLT